MSRRSAFEPSGISRRDFLRSTSCLALGLPAAGPALSAAEPGRPAEEAPARGRCASTRATRATSPTARAGRCTSPARTPGTTWWTWAGATRPRRSTSTPTSTSSGATATTSSGSWAWDSVTWDTPRQRGARQGLRAPCRAAALGADGTGQGPRRQAEVRPEGVRPRLLRAAAGPHRRRGTARDLRLRDAVRRLGADARQPRPGRAGGLGVAGASRSTPTTTSTASMPARRRRPRRDRAPPRRPGDERAPGRLHPQGGGHRERPGQRALRGHQRGRAEGVGLVGRPDHPRPRADEAEAAPGRDHRARRGAAREHAGQPGGLDLARPRRRLRRRSAGLGRQEGQPARHGSHLGRGRHRRRGSWKSFVRGHNPIFMDPYDHAILGRGAPEQWDAAAPEPGPDPPAGGPRGPGRDDAARRPRLDDDSAWPGPAPPTSCTCPTAARSKSISPARPGRSSWSGSTPSRGRSRRASRWPAAAIGP